MPYIEEITRPDQSVNPLFSMLGIQVEQLDREAVRLRLPFREGLIQGGGVVAGGVLATLLDEAMAHAVLVRLDMEGGERTATVDMNVSFLAAVKHGTDLAAEARVVKDGSRVFFTEGTVFAGEKPVAKASASFLVLR